MHNQNDINPCWEDASTVPISVLASRVSAALPLLPNGKNPKRVLLSLGGTAAVSITLSVGADTGMVASNGVILMRNAGTMILRSEGFTWINTFGDGTSPLHVTALND